MKTVSQLDSLGYFVSAVIADKSPLEDDVFLIPGGAVDFPPISVPEGFKAKWNGAGFEMEPEVVSDAQPAEPGPELTAVPQEISKAQGISVMSQTIIGESNLWLMVKGYFDTEASEVERDLFKAITVFNRASPMLNNLKGLFNLPDSDIDQLFIEGAKVIV